MKHAYLYLLVTCVLVGALSSAALAAGSPNLLNYQGRVNDTTGVPVSDGSHPFVFRIFAAPSGGSSLWTESVNLNTSGGLFNHILGSVFALPPTLFADSSLLYLETEVNGLTLTPRTQIVSVAYARRVQTVQGSTGGTITGSVRVTDTLFASNLSSNSPLRLQTAGTTRMYIDDVSGNVGIGTITPASKLNIVEGILLLSRTGTPQSTRIAATYDTPILTTSDGSAINSPPGYLNGGSAYQSIGLSANSFYSPGSGTWQNPVLSGSPSWALVMNSCGAGSCGDPGDHFEISRAPATAGTPAFAQFLYINSLGNAGIGTSTPAYKLDVNGTINATGDLNLSLGKAYRIGGTKILSNPGVFNTFLGVYAGDSLTSGYNNAFLGFDAGGYNTTGYANTFLGCYAGTYNTTGWFNSFVGMQAGFNNTTGTANTFLGLQAGLNNTTGGGNAFVGYAAGESNVDGYSNTFLGTDAGDKNTSGHYNTFVGASTGFTTSTGSDNSMVGTSAGLYNTTGYSNSFLGKDAGYSCGTGYENSVLGARAAYNNTTGYHNSFFGFEAGVTNLTGSDLTAIGYQAVSTDGLTNASAIGATASVTASNTMVFGNTSVIGWGFGVNAASGHALEVGANTSNGNGAYLTTGGSWTNASDRNKKEHFVPVDGEDLLKKIDQVPITTWNYKGESRAIRHIGPMAQDFSRIFQVGNDDKSISTIDPAGIALAAIKELHKQMQDLLRTRDELTVVTSQVSALRAENTRLKRVNDAMNEAQSLASARILRIETILAELASTPVQPVTVAQKDVQ